ncbi:Ig-like domain-containing protein [Streptococcus suis]
MKKNYIVLFTTLLIALLGNFSQEVRADVSDEIITAVTAYDKNGDPDAVNISQFEQFNIKIDFDLSKGHVRPGDQFQIQLINVLEFPNNASFQVVDTKGHAIATAEVDEKSKQIILTFTEQVRQYNQSTGTISFYVRLDTDVVTQPSEIPVELVIMGQYYIPTLLNYRGPEVQGTAPIQKAGWQTEVPNTIQYGLAVNRPGYQFQQLQIADQVLLEGTTIDYNSVRIFVGDWVYTNGKWSLENSVEATNQFKLVQNSGKNGFTINFGNKLSNKGALVRYQAKLGQPLADQSIVTSHIASTSELSQYNYTGKPNYTYILYQGQIGQ